MAYSNPYIGAYQPMYAPFAPPMQDQTRQAWQQMQPTQMSVANAPQQDAMIWVQGEAGAKAYMVAAGNSVVLWDSEADVIYIKSADANGMPYMRVFDYTERNAAPRNVSQANANQFVTREEFNQFVAKFEQKNKSTGLMEDNNAESAI